MKLRDLLAGVPLTGGNADLNMEINSISYDSRTLEPGALFVTLSGSKTDGHRYVAQALEEETDLSVTDVVWKDTERGAEVTVELNWKGQPLTVTAAV